MYNLYSTKYLYLIDKMKTLNNIQKISKVVILFYPL